MRLELAVHQVDQVSFGSGTRLLGANLQVDRSDECGDGVVRSFYRRAGACPTKEEAGQQSVASCRLVAHCHQRKLHRASSPGSTSR